MIHLDTNYLIGLLVRGSPEAATVDQWLASNELLATSAIAWIAAAAIIAGAEFATVNQADFKAFAALGLKLK
jgi:predicted nucleic acid-binding protein